MTRRLCKIRLPVWILQPTSKQQALKSRVNADAVPPTLPHIPNHLAAALAVEGGTKPGKADLQVGPLRSYTTRPASNVMSHFMFGKSSVGIVYGSRSPTAMSASLPRSVPHWNLDPLAYAADLKE